MKQCFQKRGFDNAKHAGNRSHIYKVLGVDNGLVHQSKRISQRARTGACDNVQGISFILDLFKVQNVFQMFKYKVLRDLFKSKMLCT